MDKPVIQFAQLNPGAILPKRATPGSGAFDLFVPTAGMIEPGQKCKIGTGIAHQINDDQLEDEAADGWLFSLQGIMISRSGLAANSDIRLFYQGLIDHDYRGEISVLIENCGTTPFFWKAGDRLCQMAYVVCFMGEAGVIDPSELSVTQRGTGGHGSTGR